MKSDEFEVIKKSLIYEDKTLILRQDTVLTPNKETIERKVIEYHPSSVIVPIKLDSEKRVLLIKHFRYPIGRYLWEIPGGIKRNDESNENCAVRECLEETGYQVSNVEPLISFFPEPAFTNQILYIYTGMLMNDFKGLLPSEEIKETRLFTFQEAMEMIYKDEIASSWSIIGLMLAFEQHKQS